MGLFNQHFVLAFQLAVLWLQDGCSGSSAHILSFTNRKLWIFLGVRKGLSPAPVRLSERKVFCGSPVVDSHYTSV